MAKDKNTLEDAKAQLNEAADSMTGEILEIEFEDYKFKVDTDLIDDVEALDIIDKIENQNNMKAIVDFLNYLVGAEGYEKMKAHFVERDGRFRISTLSKIYVAIFEKFDPKG